MTRVLPLYLTNLLETFPDIMSAPPWVVATVHLFIATSTVPPRGRTRVGGRRSRVSRRQPRDEASSSSVDRFGTEVSPVARYNTAVSEEAAASGAVSPCLLCYSSKVLRTQETELKGGQAMCVVGDPKISPERINDHIRVSKYHDMNLYSSWVTTDSDC